MEGPMADMQFKGLWQVAANTPNLATAIPSNQDGYGWIAQTVDPLVPETPPAGMPGVTGGPKIKSGDWIVWNAGSSTYGVVAQATVAEMTSSCYSRCVEPPVSQIEWGWQLPAAP